MLALTQKCQCSCVHCGSFYDKKEDKKELSREQIIQLIDKSALMGFSKVTFFGGEPLLVPELVAYIKHAAKMGLYTHVETNGLLLDENMVKRLKQANLSLVHVSIDSPDPQIHDQLRGVKGIFDKAVSGIRYCKKYNLRCHISTYATKENLRNGKLVGIINLAKNLGVGVRILSPIKSGKWIGSDRIVLSKEEINLLRSLLEKHKVFWENIDNAKSPFSCVSYKKRLVYVSAYGDVQPCCYIAINFGNITKEPFSKIIQRMWNSCLYDKSMKNNTSDCLANALEFDLTTGKNIYPQPHEDYFAFKKNKEWDDWASTYEREVDYLVGINDNFVLKKIDFNGKSVLDMGTGTGRFAKRVISSVRNITLVDFSDNMIRECKKNLGYSSKVSFLNMNIEEKDFFLQEKFDIITVFHLLHHLKNPWQALENLKSCLAENGKLVVVDVLKNNGKINNLIFHLKLVSRYGIFKYLWQNYIADNTSLKQHLAREKYETLDEFKNKYQELLPAADIKKINGIFCLLIWENIF